jgi:hypothetical protein
VLGGATVVLYGLVGVLGVRIWLTNRVDFAKPATSADPPPFVDHRHRQLHLARGNLTFTG